MTSVARCLLVAALAATTTSTALAGSIDPGTRIRWTTARDSGWPTIGVVTSVSAETLVARAERDTGLRAMPLESLASLEVSAGRPNRCARGALTGALAGGLGAVAVASVVGWVVHETVKPWLGSGRARVGSDDVVIGLVGAGVGATAGAIAGACLHGPERWRPVEDVGAKAARR